MNGRILWRSRAKTLLILTSSSQVALLLYILFFTSCVEPQTSDAIIAHRKHQSFLESVLFFVAPPLFLLSLHYGVVAWLCAKQRVSVREIAYLFWGGALGALLPVLVADWVWAMGQLQSKRCGLIGPPLFLWALPAGLVTMPIGWIAGMKVAQIGGDSTLSLQSKISSEPATSSNTIRKIDRRICWLCFSGFIVPIVLFACMLSIIEHTSARQSQDSYSPMIGWILGPFLFSLPTAIPICIHASLMFFLLKDERFSRAMKGAILWLGTVGAYAPTAIWFFSVFTSIVKKKPLLGGDFMVLNWIWLVYVLPAGLIATWVGYLIGFCLGRLADARGQEK